jgi:hypothetical protein
MFRAALTLSASLFLGSLFLTAQQPVELPQQQVDIWRHSLGPEQAVHLPEADLGAPPKGRGFMGHDYVEFNVIVSANGRPESATPTTGKAGMSNTPPHLDEATAIIMSRSYKPWLINGVPTRVKVQDYVQLLPPERYGAHVQFPEVTDLSSVRIGLRRTACYGSCPDYQVTLNGDGSIHFNGQRFVLIPGDHTAHISQDKVRELLTLFRKADFFSANNDYRGGWTDNPTQTVSLTIGPLSKTVTDYVGTDAGLPLAIRNLEEEIDEAADTARWISTDDTTLPSLIAEKWDFAAPGAANLALYNILLAPSADGTRSAVNKQLLDHFIAVRAPIVSPGFSTPSPICAATAIGDLALVRRMADSARMGSPSKPFPAPVLSQCLASAARSASSPLFQFWLDHGATLKAPLGLPEPNSGRFGSSLLADVVLGGDLSIARRVLNADRSNLSSPYSGIPLLTWTIDHSHTKQLPQLISMLAAAGADPNARDSRGEPPLIAASFIGDGKAAAVPALLAAGADPNGRDNGGRTALIAHCFMEDVVKYLLAANADPTFTDKQGRTALVAARQTSCSACVTLIQQALDKRQPKSATAQ